jgi:hypothetical protein
MEPVSFFAIAVDDAAVGGIGYSLHDDVERVSAEIGYWLGTAYWGRGIMTSAVAAVTRFAFKRHEGLRRVYAVPYAAGIARFSQVASRRTLCSQHVAALGVLTTSAGDLAAQRQRTTSIRAVCPGAAPSGASHVTTGLAIASASATYTAS